MKIIYDIKFPRMRVIRNRAGSARKFMRNREKNWWFCDPISLGTQKLHVYGMVRRGTWTCNIIAMEVTDKNIVILRKQKEIL